MHYSAIEFFISNEVVGEFAAKDVLEVGSRYVSGSVRPFVERFLHPARYVGRYVNLIVPAENLTEYFGENSFDIVVATELLEHVVDWRSAINNMKRVLKVGGYAYATTRSFGAPCHDYSRDFWRYEIPDMKKIFSDFEITILQNDPGDIQNPGIFLKARKRSGEGLADLSSVELYSMVTGKRTLETPKPVNMPISRRMKLSMVILRSKLLRHVRIGCFWIDADYRTLMNFCSA